MPDITSNLAAHWQFDEGSGGTATDASGNGHNGTLSGTTPPGYDAGKIGSNSLSFDGSSSVVDGFSVSLGATHTVAAWVYISSGPNYRGILVEGNFLGPFIDVATGGANRHLNYYLVGDNRNSTAIPANEWHHIAVVRDGADLAFYVDGALDGTASRPGSEATTFTPTRIGNDSSGEAFGGKLDDIRAYTRALTADDIAALYAYTGSSGVSADLSATLGAASSSAGASALVQAALAASLGAVNLSSDASALVRALLNTSFSPATLSAGALESVQGAAAMILGAATMSASGSLVVQGDAAILLGALITVLPSLGLVPAAAGDSVYDLLRNLAGDHFQPGDSENDLWRKYTGYAGPRNSAYDMVFANTPGALPGDSFNDLLRKLVGASGTAGTSDRDLIARLLT